MLKVRAAALALLLAGCATAASAPKAADENPLFDGADPDALVVGTTLWLYPSGDERLLAWSRKDGFWGPRGVLLRKSDIGWINDDGARRHYLWAPDMVAVNGRYYLYYSVGPQDPTPSRIGVAVGERPEGPFRDSGRPLLTGGAGFEAIDPMVFRDPATKRHYLYAGGSAGATLRVFLLAPDLVRIEREVAVQQPAHFTEAPFVHFRNGLYYLSYSQGRWYTAEYSVHYATGPSATGPWRYRGVILASDSRHKGPGHHSFVTDPETGAELIVYHRWDNRRGRGPYHGSRSVAIERVRYLADGTIVPIAMTGG